MMPTMTKPLGSLPKFMPLDRFEFALVLVLIVIETFAPTGVATLKFTCLYAPIKYVTNIVATSITFEVVNSSNVASIFHGRVLVRKYIALPLWCTSEV
jgi:hypothetical protein